MLTELSSSQIYLKYCMINPRTLALDVEVSILMWYVGISYWTENVMIELNV